VVKDIRRYYVMRPKAQARFQPDLKLVDVLLHKVSSECDFIWCRTNS